MSKTKILTILVGVLILINGLLIGWIVLGSTHSHKRHDKMHSGPKQMIIDRLEFSEEQVKLYESSINKHRKDVRELEYKIRLKKNELYSGLNSKSSINSEAVTSELSLLISQMENVHYAHFNEIKSICKGNQIGKFDELTKELARLFTPPRKKHRKRK
ncbi:MAG: hypothetical protein ACPGD5_03790 [Salibacteraceae bacterium]